MITHNIGTRQQWLKARLELLAAEKELTRRSDEIARRRQELPWVRIEKEYHFETDEGDATLAELFRGRSQLLIYHFMFGPDYSAGCPSCSAIADGFNGFWIHLANHDVILMAISRAPLAKLQAYKRRMGWTFPWVSSFGSDFNFDYHVSFTKDELARGRVFYNYRETASEDAHDELPGMSAFIRDEAGDLYHTYSEYARGGEEILSTLMVLDRAPKGRNETGIWWRRHDEYDEPAKSAAGTAAR